MAAAQNENYKIILVYFAKNIIRIRFTLFHVIHKSDCEILTTLAFNILNLLFVNGYFSNDKRLMDHINSTMLFSLRGFTRNICIKEGKLFTKVLGTKLEYLSLIIQETFFLGAHVLQ